MMFSGNIPAKLDNKGRVALPSPFRRLLPENETEFVVRRDIFQPCLVIYPQSAWLKEVECLRNKLNRWNAQEAMIFRQFISEAELITLDAAGRFLIPKRMQLKAKIEREVLFVGIDDRIEIWNKENMTAAFLSDDQLGTTMEKLLAGTSLKTD